jgi:hypothetical protein
MNYKNWTADQLKYISDNMNLTDKELSLNIGKTEKAIRTKRRRQGLRKAERVLCPSKWDQPEIDAYVSLWQVKTGKELAAHYGVTRRAICHINQKLSLKKGEAWKSEIAKISYQHQKNQRKKRKDAKSIGYITTRKNQKGLIITWILTESGWQQMHIYNWLQAGREIPKGYALYFKDRNPENHNLENIELKSRGDIARENKVEYYKKHPSKRSKIIPREKKEYASKEEKEHQQQAKRLRKEQLKLEKIKAKQEERRRILESKKQAKAELEWQRASKRNKREKKLPNRPLNLASKIAVKIDHKTIVYVNPGTDIEMIRRQYLKAS